MKYRVTVIFEARPWYDDNWQGPEGARRYIDAHLNKVLNSESERCIIEKVEPV